MGALTASFLMRVENNWRNIQDNEYARLASNLWWRDLTKTIPSVSSKEIVLFILSTMQIEDIGKDGGNIPFDDLAQLVTQYENRTHGAGLKLHRNQFEDADGNGVQLGAKWSADAGAYMAYYPQKKVVEALVTRGEDTDFPSFDGKPLFATDHPYNPFRTELGSYSNLFTAYPIDESVTEEVALSNLGKLINAIRSIKMPNGVDPRFLGPTGFRLVVPPALQQRAVTLTKAKFIAKAASSGGGSADVEALISSYGWQPPLIADELAPLPTDDNTVTANKNKTYYLSVQQMSSSELGALVWVEREAFSVTYYTGQGGGTGVDAILDRTRELEWHVQGRNVCGPGFPYLIFKQRPA